MTTQLIHHYILTTAKSIDCVTHQDVMEACRLSRNFSAPEKCENPFEGFMADSARSIIETSRDMLTVTGGSVPLLQKCELETISSNIKRIADKIENDSNSGNSLTTVYEMTDFLECIIGLNTSAMKADDFDERSFSYLYLNLLYMLHTFTKSLQQVLKSNAITSR